MIDVLISVAAAFVGTLGFCVLFNAHGKKMILAAVNGAFGFALYTASGVAFQSDAFRYFLVAVTTTLVAEFLARRYKTPVTSFCVLSLMPLVPGSSLYATARSALGNDKSMFVPNLLNTLKLAISLALGIVTVLAIFRYLINRRVRWNDPIK